MTPVLGRAQLASTGCGLAMAAATGIHTTGATFVLAALSALAVMGGIVFPRAATLAVLLAGSAVMLTDTPALAAGLAGLAAACYLLLRHNEQAVTPLRGPPAWPMVFAALGFTVIGVLAASFSVELRWLPLLAPAAAFAAYVIATAAFPHAAVAKKP